MLTRKETLFWGVLTRELEGATIRHKTSAKGAPHVTHHASRITHHASRIIGLVLLFAFAAKLVQATFYFRVAHSPSWAVASALDLSVGALLVIVPRSRVANFLGALLFLVYFSFHIVVRPQSCDCFGAFSKWFMADGIQWFTLSGLVACTAGAVIQSNVRITEWQLVRGAIPKVAASSVGLVFACLVGNAVIGQELIATAEQMVPVPNSIHYSGELVIKNLSSTPIRVLGIRAGCGQGIGLYAPIEILPGAAFTVPSTLAGVNSGVFVDGGFSLYIEKGGYAQIVEVKWVGKLSSGLS